MQCHGLLWFLGLGFHSVAVLVMGMHSSSGDCFEILKTRSDFFLYSFFEHLFLLCLIVDNRSRDDFFFFLCLFEFLECWQCCCLFGFLVLGFHS